MLPSVTILKSILSLYIPLLQTSATASMRMAIAGLVISAESSSLVLFQKNGGTFLQFLWTIK